MITFLVLWHNHFLLLDCIIHLIHNNQFVHTSGYELSNALESLFGSLVYKKKKKTLLTHSWINPKIHTYTSHLILLRFQYILTAVSAAFSMWVWALFFSLLCTPWLSLSLWYSPDGNKTTQAQAVRSRGPWSQWAYIQNHVLNCPAESEQGKQM